MPTFLVPAHASVIVHGSTHTCYFFVKYLYINVCYKIFNVFICVSLCLTDFIVGCFVVVPGHPHGQGSWLALERRLDTYSV